MSYEEERRDAVMDAMDELDATDKALKRALQYGLPKKLDRRVKRILKDLGVVPGHSLGLLADDFPGFEGITLVATMRRFDRLRDAGEPLTI